MTADQVYETAGFAATEHEWLTVGLEDMRRRAREMGIDPGVRRTGRTTRNACEAVAQADSGHEVWCAADSYAKAKILHRTALRVASLIHRLDLAPLIKLAPPVSQRADMLRGMAYEPVLVMDHGAP